jgi:pyruvate/2-oxoglutarate dehydrogenase complex dihydrolipoamide dehydrogenase (E3) component
MQSGRLFKGNAMEIFDAIIIGSGQAGNPLAKRLSKEGRRVALIECDSVGGTCVNYGCTPTKTLIGSAKNIFQAERAAEYGLTLIDGVPDYQAIIRRKNRIVAGFREDLEKSLVQDPNITLLRGKGTFLKYKELRVQLNDLSHVDIGAESIFINTGTRPRIPDIEGLHSIRYLTSTTILELDVLPEHLMIIGGGYVALEFAQIFRRIGSLVTIVERSSRLLQNEDEDVALELMNILEREGVQVILDAPVRSITGHANDRISIEILTSGQRATLTGTHLLVATGRTPNTEDLDLVKTSIKTDKDGYIPVNDHLETAVSGIYALGDVKGGPAFTHVSYHDYVVLSQNMFERKQSSIRNRLIPYCVFTDPELGRIGLTEKAAREKGLEFTVAKMKTSSIARAIETGETTGFVKAIIDNNTKTILGAAVICAGGGELMSLLQIAMMGGLTYDQLRDTMFAHPTYAESINNLFSATHLQP